MYAINRGTKLYFGQVFWFRRMHLLKFTFSLRLTQYLLGIFPNILLPVASLTRKLPNLHSPDYYSQKMCTDIFLKNNSHTSWFAVNRFLIKRYVYVLVREQYVLDQDFYAQLLVQPVVSTLLMLTLFLCFDWWISNVSRYFLEYTAFI